MSFILTDSWKISAIIKLSIKKIPGCMTYVVHPGTCTGTDTPVSRYFVSMVGTRIR